MFTGIGGFELGIQRAFDNEYARVSEESEQEERSQGRKRPSDKQPVLLHNRDRTAPLCIGYSEIDKYAIETYQHRFGKEVKNYGDATTINTAELPDFDLLVGGFPCQAFSVAGKRAGFNDTRGTLIFDVVRILRDKRPRHFVLENVKGLLSHESGKTFSHILEILTDSGYDVSWSVHNSKNYGVPQNRERIYLIGNLRGEPRPQVFPIATDDGEDTQSDKGRSTELFPTIRATHYKNGDNQPLISKTVRSGGRNSPHGSKQNWDSYEVEGTIRRLTPTECERLQGFPDNWTIGSDTQRYKQCGNAVTVNVVEHVVSELLAPTPTTNE